MPPRMLMRRSRAASAVEPPLGGALSRPAEVISLDDEICAANTNQQTGRDTDGAAESQQRCDYGSAAVPLSEPCSPSSTATTSSRSALAGLLAGSQRPAGLPVPGRGGAANSRARERTAERRDDASEAVLRNEKESRDSGDAELWTVKHAPCSEAKMVVHKKKVEEVRQWLTQQAQRAGLAAALRHGVGSGSPASKCKLALFTGPAGSGKSATIEVLAAEIGLEVCEWQTAAQSTWQEFNSIYQGGAASSAAGNVSGADVVRYESKLDAFLSFVDRARLPALSLLEARNDTQTVRNTTTAHTTNTTNTTNTNDDGEAKSPAPPPPLSRPKLIVIDDLPYASDATQRRRVAQALKDLAHSSRFPVVLIATTASDGGKSGASSSSSSSYGTGSHRGGGQADAVGGHLGLHKELISALQAVGAPTIAFNPITALNTAKALRNVLEKERRSLPEGQLTAIAEQAGGDLRNALLTLQFACLGTAPAVMAPASKRRRCKNAIDTAAIEAGVERVSFLLRDTSLGVLHGLGKLLYNKRLPSKQQQQQQQQQIEHGQGRCAAWAVRPPMDGFDPEQVLQRSGLQSTSVTAFLHENIHFFINDAAILDMAGCLAQLSAADALATGGKRARGRGGDATMADDEPIAGGSTLSDAAAASVAARGVCFWNFHPAPSRWQPLRGPISFLAQRGMVENAQHLEETVARARIVHGGAGGLDARSTLATEILPYVSRIGHAGVWKQLAPPSTVLQQPTRWFRIWEGQLYETVGPGSSAPQQESTGDDDAAGAPGGCIEAIEEPGDNW